MNDIFYLKQTKEIKIKQLIMQLKTLKIKKKKELKSTTEVYDLSMPSKHYILENGIISHNSGALYNSSVINFLYKAKLEATTESKKVGLTKSGIVVRSAPNKNRFARPITIRFHISFYKGMNPYVGLEQFISWKNCGIQKGTILSQSDYKKLKPEQKKIVEENDYLWKDDKGKEYVFWPKDTARNFVVKHLNGTIKTSELFSNKVFTPEILKKLDENVIKETFTLPKVGELNDDFEDLAEQDIEKENEEFDTEEQLKDTLNPEILTKEKIEDD